MLSKKHRFTKQRNRYGRTQVWDSKAARWRDLDEVLETWTEGADTSFFSRLPFDDSPASNRVHEAGGMDGLSKSKPFEGGAAGGGREFHNGASSTFDGESTYGGGGSDGGSCGGSDGGGGM